MGYPLGGRVTINCDCGLVNPNSQPCGANSAQCREVSHAQSCFQIQQGYHRSCLAGAGQVLLLGAHLEQHAPPP